MNEQEKYDWMVYVSCMTYNHAPYIVDAMNGFTMQETNFPFVCAVVDDASTDGEQEVIKSYLNEHFDLEDNSVVRHEETDDYVLTFARHKTNLNCYFAVLYLKYNHYKKKSKVPYISQWRDKAKYIAICEGDDYWIAPNKLQKQVDFMENHPNCQLCGTNALELWDGGVKAPKYFHTYHQTGIVPIEKIIGHWLFATASVFYKRELHDDYPEWTKQLPFGDMPLILIAAYYGEIGVLENVTTVYRRSQSNSSSATNQFRRNMDFIRERQLFMYEEYQKWTHGKYFNVVEKQIQFLKKDIKWIKYLYKNRYLPWLMMPIFTIKKHFKKI